MPEKIHRTVVRNQAYSSGAFSTRERHNERKNECYGNGDIDPARSDMNIQFRRVLSPDGTPETYEQTYNRLLSEGVIVRHGLKPDAKVFDELIFDVNSAYFEDHGGYGYARDFFAEAYRLAVDEAGGEQYVLSAVMHADEKNVRLSEKLGQDVYHYHLHVVYIPVVQKELYFKKNNKNPELAGKLKAIIPQISHSKKWPLKTLVEKNGKTFFVNSYSLLQDRFFEHMRAAGFEDFERGERGSTAEHLSDLEYKTKQETERAAAMEAAADEKQKSVAVLETKAKQKSEQLSILDKRIRTAKQTGVTFHDIESAAAPAMLGNKVYLSKEDWEKISALAKRGVVADAQKTDLQRKLEEEKRGSEIWRMRYEQLKNPQPEQQRRDSAERYPEEKNKKQYRQEAR